MCLTINGCVLPENYTVFDGIDYEHIQFKELSTETKTFLRSINDTEVSLSYMEDDLLHQYPSAKIIYLGNNAVYVCGLIN